MAPEAVARVSYPGDRHRWPADAKPYFIVSGKREPVIGFKDDWRAHRAGIGIGLRDKP